MEIEFIPEICCDLCDEVIHNHMSECPACKKKYAGTSIYGAMYDVFHKKEIPEFQCEDCKATIRACKTTEEILNNEGFNNTEWIVMLY
jgi:hypothetical protein